MQNKMHRIKMFVGNNSFLTAVRFSNCDPEVAGD